MLTPAPVRLIATDLDDTLLRGDKTISARTRAIIQRAKARGIRFVPVTARPPRAYHLIAEEIGPTELAICCNGALVYDIPRAAILRHHQIPAPTASAIVATLRAALPDMYYGAETGLDFVCEPEYVTLRQIAKPPGIRFAPAEEFAATPLTKLMAIHPTIPALEVLPTVQALVGDQVTVTNSGLPVIEIMALGVDKGTALAELCASLGITRDEVVAFGDMLNDLPMLRWAGLGVAVGNAHPEVLAAADAVTLACENDGLAALVEELLTGGENEVTR